MGRTRDSLPRCLAPLAGLLEDTPAAIRIGFEDMLEQRRALGLVKGRVVRPWKALVEDVLDGQPKLLVAQMRKRVATALLARYPTETMASRL